MNHRRRMVNFFGFTLVVSTLLVHIDAFAILGLSATNQNCTNEGQEVVVPLVSNYPCITCMCKDGHVQCRKETCPSTQGCYLLVNDKTNKTKCCNVCKGCHYQGVHYENGREWTDGQHPCQVLSCHGGVITIANQSCQTQCNNPLPPAPGQCCPRCPDCTFNGKKLTEGQSASDPEDPCVRCQCTAGGLVCAKKACPVLTCPASKTVLKPGACCAECQGSHGDFEPKGRCLVGKKFYQNGSAFRPDSCTNCTCRDTTSVCHRQVCPPVKLCPPGVQEEVDVCCPKCRPVPPMKTAPAVNALPTQISPTLPASRPSTCSYRGVTYQDGGTWSLDSCTQCMCNKGEVRCSVQQCPVYRTRNEIHSHHGQSKASKSSKSKKNKMWRSTPPTFTNAQASPCPAGHHPVKEPGQCCPKCVEDDAVCTVFGDPHYRTYDGRVFNFQGACKYLLTSDCKNNSFSVRVTNDARSSQSFSWTKTVTLTIEDLKVTLGQNMKVKVNHKRVSLPFVSLGVLSIVQEGYSVVVRTNIGVKLLWDGESFLEVTVPPAYKNRLCGLCGNFNGRRQDDLRMRSGQMAKSINQFGNSWKVGGPKSCSRQEPPAGSSPSSAHSANKVTGSSASGASSGERQSAAGREPLCQRQWEVRIRAVRECNALKALMFAPCHKKVSPVRYFKSCLLDMCECPGGKQCYCEALTAYAHECERHDVIVDPKWREMTSCTGHGPPAMTSRPPTVLDASP